MKYLCPKCKAELQKEAHSYRCEHGHTYDIAKSGYTNLFLSNKKMSGDNKEMVQARTQFLSNGYYQPLQEKLCSIIKKLAPKTIVDAGCGEGYYTNACKNVCEHSEFFGFDVSKFALQQAAKAKNGVQYAVASVADLPLADSSADVIISVFAPIYIEEFQRILKEGGFFIKVEPGPKHLYDLKQILYTDVYDNEAEAVFYEGMKLSDEQLLEYVCDIHSQADIKALFQMTPYYYRSPKQTSEQLQAMQQLSTRIQFHIELYQKEKR